MNFFNPYGVFGYGMTPQQQTLSQLKAIQRHKQSVVDAQNKVSRLEKEKANLISERDGYSLKNTHDVSKEKRANEEKNENIREIWATMDRAENTSRKLARGTMIASFLLAVATLVVTLVLPYYSTEEWAKIELAMGPLLVSPFLGIGVYLLFYHVMDRIRIARTYETRSEPDPSSLKAALITSIVAGVFYLVHGGILLEEIGDFLFVVKPLVIQAPIWGLALMVKMISSIVLKCVYRRCDRRERDYVWAKEKEIAAAAESDKRESEAYARENADWKARRRTSFAPKIAEKEKEIESAKMALRQIPRPTEYQLYPFLEKESVDYIDALVGLVENGRADTVKEAVNLQRQIVDERIRVWEARERAKELSKQQQLANDRLEEHARRTRAAEEERAEAAKRAADELERIRKEMEDKK